MDEFNEKDLNGSEEYTEPVPEDAGLQGYGDITDGQDVADEAAPATEETPAEQENSFEYHFVRPDAGKSFDSGYHEPRFDPETGEPLAGKEEKQSAPVYEYYDSPYTSTYTGPSPVKEKKTRTKRERRGPGIGMTFLCCLLALACGFGGAWSYEKFFAPERNTVIYQTVEPSIVSTPDNNTASLADLVDICKPSVVEVYTEILSATSFFGTQKSTAAGSGVIISGDGFIVTNHHVIDGANTVSVVTAMGKRYAAKIYGYDEANDLALLKIDATDLTPAVFADSSALRVGDSIFAIGNPLGTLGGSVSEGIISALDRDITVEGKEMTLMQITAAVNPGNSGGGLFNAAGELVGIVNAKSIGDDVEGIGFAIPGNLAKEIVAQIRENGGETVTTSGPVLGVTVITIDSNEAAAQYKVTRLGVYIVGISEGLGAEKAGLQPGDYIVSVDDYAIEKTSDLTGYLAKCNEGDIVTVQVIRDNRMMNFEVELMIAG